MMKTVLIDEKSTDSVGYLCILRIWPSSTMKLPGSSCPARGKRDLESNIRRNQIH